MRAAIIAMMILLLPAALFAAAPPTMGIYFTLSGYQMHSSPMPGEYFFGYVYARSTDCSIAAAEFAMEIPEGIYISSTILPAGTSFAMGGLPEGISLTYYPPLDGWADYTLIVTVVLYAAENSCYANGGTLVDAPIRIIGYPASGLVQGVCWEGDLLFPYIGLTSTLCPEMIGVQDTNWGAIKSLF